MAGVSQPSPLLGARQQAQARRGAGDVAGARAVLEYAVEVGKSRLGEDDPDVLVTLHELARLYQETDDPMAARRVLEEAYAAGQWRLGDSDPLMLEISFDLGVVAEELGNRHEARKAFGRIAGAGAEVLGPDHWAVARARAYLGDDPQIPGPPAAGTPEPADRGGPRPGMERTDMGAAQERTEVGSALDEPTIVQQAVQPRSARPAQDPRVPTSDEVGPGLTMERSPTLHRLHQPVSQSPNGAVAGRPGLTAEQPAARHFGGTGDAPGGAAGQGASGSPYRRRGVAIYAAIAASLAAIIAVVALVVVLADRRSPGDDTNVPTLSGPPPTDVQLADNGAAITVTWTDPADGKTTFLVTMGRPGEVLKSVGQVGPGQTSFKMDGLNTRVDYCFAVVAVYSTTRFATSPQACTSRSSTR
jgi:hypothetical protein